jgi:hypothetical protein
MTTTIIHPSVRPSLRTALSLNAAFSLSTGTAALVLGEPIDEFLDFGLPWLVRLIGGGLIAFAAFLLVLTRLDDVDSMATEALAVSVADLGWVLATMVLIALGVFSPWGSALMSAVAVVVLLLAVAQLRARAALRSTGLRPVGSATN